MLGRLNVETPSKLGPLKAEFFFVDTNKVDTYANPDVDAEHNICSRSHNQPPLPLGCNGTSITGPDTCWKFFDDLWKEA